MMAFIKTHLISLVSGLAALVFIGVAAWGMTRDNVVKAMQEQAAIAGKIRSLRSNPKNEACIQAEAERGQRFAEEYAATVAVAEEINRREVLMPGVFPVPQNDATAYAFRDAYRDAIRKLPRGKLNGGGLPTEAEIAEAQNDIVEIAEREAAEREEGEMAPPVAAGAPRPALPAPTIAGVPTGAPRIAGPGGGPRIAGPPGGATVPGIAGRSSAGPSILQADPKKDARARAAITKARRIRCYVDENPTSENPTFHISPIWDLSTRPVPDQMWYAQVGLWIQQDIVEAVAELNDQAARQLDPDAVHVENMPVKRLQAIRVMGYWTDYGPVSFPVYGRSSGVVPLQTGDTFTGRVGNELFDVVRFTVVAVVDQRDLLAVIDAITRKNFYQLTGISLEAVPPDAPDYAQGYLYGPAPVVRATLQFEGYLARNVYEKLFPPEVRVALGIEDAQGKKGKRP